MSLKAKKVLSLLASVMCMLPLYVVLHEGGHALIAVLCGARVTSFSVAAASMSYQGGRFTALTLSLFHAAGVLLPVLAAVVYMSEANEIRVLLHRFLYGLADANGLHPRLGDCAGFIPDGVSAPG